MELWTRNETAASWKEWPDPLQGLAWLVEHPSDEVLLLALQPDEELPDLTAAVRLIRATTGTSTRIVVASPHPADAWLLPLREIGIDRVWWVARSTSRRLRPGPIPAQAQDIHGPVCPALHAATASGSALSLCGRHRDRMVLASHHLERWCLGDHATCPHWKYGPGWLAEDDG